MSKHVHPVLLSHEKARLEDAQLRVADAITKFAGSMAFVYIHIAIFAIWIITGLFGLDKYPFGFLTLVVSLEAIFLATFVMIGQNRQAEFAALKADHDFVVQEQELQANTQLTRDVHGLVTQIHGIVQPMAASQEKQKQIDAKYGTVINNTTLITDGSKTDNRPNGEANTAPLQ